MPLLCFEVISTTDESRKAWGLMEIIRTGGRNLPRWRRNFSEWRDGGNGCRISVGKVQLEASDRTFPMVLKLGTAEGLFLQPAEKSAPFFPLKLKRGEGAWIREVHDDLSLTAAYHAATQLVVHCRKGFPDPDTLVTQLSFCDREAARDRQQKQNASVSIEKCRRENPQLMRRPYPFFFGFSR